MNSSVINSSQVFSHASLGFSLPLWYVFDMCKESPGGFVFLYAVKVLNLLVGFPANVMVMWQLARKKSDSSTSNIFIFNLAIADAYFCSMTPIDLVNWLLLSNSEIRYFQRFAYGIKETTPLFLTCICLDRYVAVVHPIVFTSIKDNKIRVVVSILVWGLMLAFALRRAWGSDETINIFSGLILFAFSIMIFCNVSIMWGLRKSVLGKEKMHPMKKKALRTVIITLAIIVFNYLPPVAVFPFKAFYTFQAFQCKVKIIVFSIMDLSSSIEPVLYISKSEHMPCRANFPCICFQNPSNEPHNVSK